MGAPANLKEKIAKKAGECGFDVVQFTKPDAIKPAAAHLKKFIAAGKSSLPQAITATWSGLKQLNSGAVRRTNYGLRCAQ